MEKEEVLNAKDPKKATNSLKNRLLSAVKVLWVVIIIATAAYFFYKNRAEVVRLINEISFWRILLSLLLLFVGKAMIVLFVQYSIKSQGLKMPFMKTLGLYGVTSMGKYIPGGIWHFVGRFGAYRMNGLSNRQATTALIMDNTWLLSSAVFTGVLTTIVGRFDLISNFLKIPAALWVKIIFALITISLWAGVLHLINLYLKKRAAGPLQPVWKLLVIGFTLWVFMGLSFFIMFPNMPASQAGIFIAGYAVSWSVGYVAVFAPGGLGVREVLLGLIFTQIAPIETIAVYAAMNRIIWLVAELTFGMVGIIQKQEIMPKFSEKTELEPVNAQQTDEPKLPEPEDPSKPEL